MLFLRLLLLSLSFCGLFIPIYGHKYQQIDDQLIISNSTPLYARLDAAGHANSGHVHYVHAISPDSRNKYLETDDFATAVDDEAAGNENTAVTVNVLANDTYFIFPINPETVDLNVADADVQSTASTTAGSYEVDGDGIVTFMPALNFSGIAVINYTVNNTLDVTSGEATITITINDSPVAVDDPLIVTNENEPVTFNVVANDTDTDGSIDVSTVDLNVATPAIDDEITTPQGEFEVSATGDVTFTPALNFSGEATLAYTVSDDLGAISNQALITVTVNNAPVAVNDPLITTNENVQVVFNVTTNDTDSDGTIDASTVDLDTTTPAIDNSNSTPQGTFTVSATGAVTFDPATNYHGTATLTYTVNDNNGVRSNIGVITITINDAPIAVADSKDVNENITSTTLNVVSNDTDSDGTIAANTVDLDPSTVGIQDSQTIAAGAFTVSLTGIVTYTPATNFHGTVSITYTVTDDKGATSNEAAITINVNDAPVAEDDAGSTNEDVTTTLNITDNDTDSDGTKVLNTVDLDQSQAGVQGTITTLQGTFTINTTTGVLSYTPLLNFHGTATVNYTIRDNKGALSNEATVSFVVNSVNDAPVITGHQSSLSISEDQSFTVQFSNLTVTDVDNTYPTGFSIEIVPGSNYTVSGNTIIPFANFFGTLTATIKVNDGTTSSAAYTNFQLTVTPINDPPSFDPIDDMIISENAGTQTVTISNISPGPLESQTLLLNVSSGNTSLIPNPTFSYNGTANTTTLSFKPQPSQTGTAVITVRFVDNGPSEFVRTFEVQVISVNDAPTLTAIGNVTMQEDAAQQDIPLSGITAGPSENQALTVTVASNNTSLFETLEVGYTSPQTTGTLRIKPKANAFGTAQVTVTVTDDGPSSPSPSVNVFSRVFTVTVNAVNDAPVITGQQALSVSEDQSITLQLSNLLVTDPDNTYPTGFSLQVTSGTNYSVAGNVITPTANFSGLLTINTVTVSDGALTSAPYTTLQITVNPVNDAPTLTALGTVTLLEDASQQNIALSGITAGPNENQTLTVVASSTNPNLFELLHVVYTSPQTTGTLEVKPKPNASGSAVVTVTVTDDGVSTPTPNTNTFLRTFTLNVTAVNDLPEFKSTPLTTAIVGELFSDSIKVEDIDNASITLTAPTKPAWLTFTVHPSGKKAKLSGTPPVGSGGTVPIKLQAKDPGSPVTQDYQLLINSRPQVNSFSLSTSEDIDITFSTQNFASAFTDTDGNAISEIQITSLPNHGELKLNNTLLAVNSKIPSSAINELVYTPANDYHGKDTIRWNGSDGIVYSLIDAAIPLVINPVNDAPVIELLEEDVLQYGIGKDKMPLTALFTVNDADGDSIVRAEIGFRRENYTGFDLLTFTNTPKITGSFDAQTGVLILTGKASVSEYNSAVRSIQYSYLDPEHNPRDSDPLKRVYFTLSDGKAWSNTKDRGIELILTFNNLEIVNGFTPNEDDVNDEWVVIRNRTGQDLEDLKESKLAVYDKRGVLVFESIGFATRWNGKYMNKGKLMPADSYFYTIEVVDLKLKSLKKLYKGVVTVLHDKL
jgi:gliding motility-associated-like protein